MDDPTAVYQTFRCSICKRRLEKPLSLKCGHYACRHCLETILHNHRENARCSACSKSLEQYQIENYSYLSPNHHVSRLLASFPDVNQCETCRQFTIVQPCSQCSKEQCDACVGKHGDTHQQKNSKPNTSVELFSAEEKRILQSIKSKLTDKEFEDFMQVANTYLHGAATKTANKYERTAILASPARSSSPSINSKSSDSANVTTDETLFLPQAELIYDWSTHEKFTADDILRSRPERVKQLLRLGFMPRPYQIRMTSTGLRNGNSLVCLQTGAGKTFVAGMVAKFFHILSMQNRSHGSNRSRKFKAVFLVPIKALVDQQCSAFQQVFIDQWESILKPIDTQAGERFKEFYDRFDIFFFTVQKFANFIEAKHTDLNKFDLIIIDECHHCYDNHPINSMMRQYHRLKASGGSVPQIIGLTASVGTNKKNAFEHLVHLCANLDCFDICAVDKGAEEDELRNSTNTPLADTIVTVQKIENDPIVIKLKEDVMKSIAARLGYDIMSIDTDKLENFLVSEYNKACVNSDREATLGCDYLRKLNRFLLQYADLPLEQCMKKLEDVLRESLPSRPTPFEQFCQKKLDEFRQRATVIMSVETPAKAKLQKLVELIAGLHKPNDRGLILVKTKFHTVALEEYLNEQPKLVQRGIAVGRLTGQGSADELCLPGSQQMTVLNLFRKGVKSVLVATDVAQEGLDVAECSYVIRYEFVSNEIGTVQSRGRARAAQSKCFLITEALSVNYHRELDNRQKEDEMKEAIAEWRKRGVKAFAQLVRDEQDTLLREMCKNDAQQSTAEPISPTHSSARKVLCRYCDTFICDGSGLRLQGTTVVCVDPTFEKRINPPKSNGAKFICPNSTCHKELGAVIILSRNIPGYALQIAALKFVYDNEKIALIFKKWSLYKGTIKPL